MPVANDTQIGTLIRQLLDRDDLLPETVEELREYLDEIGSKGSLNRMDADYVLSLAGRLGLKGGSARHESAAPPPAANDSEGNARAPIARARELVGMLYDPDSGLNAEVSDERAVEILEELLQSLDDADAALPRG